MTKNGSIWALLVWAMFTLLLNFSSAYAQEASPQGSGNDAEATGTSAAQTTGAQTTGAQTSEAAVAVPSPSDVARTSYARGQQLFEAGDYAEAQAEFEAALAASPRPRILLAVAACQEHRGMPGAMRVTLERYLEVAPADAADRADITQRVQGLTALTGTISILGTPEGASVAIDGVTVDATVPGDVTVADGDHEVTVSMDGFVPDTQRVSISEGALTASLTFALAEETPAETEPTEEEPTTPTHPTPDSVWVLSAVTGVALVAGTVFGFAALNEQSAFDVMPNRGAADRGETLAVAADISFGVAIVAGVSAVVVYLTDRPAAAETPAAETPAATDSTESPDTESPATESPAASQARARFAPVISDREVGGMLTVEF